MKKLMSAILFIAAGMMGVGLLFSYSRGAWVGTAIGLLYLAKAHGKFKWRFVLPGIFAAAAIVLVFLERHAGHGSVVCEAAGFESGIGATPGCGLERRLCKSCGIIRLASAGTRRLRYTQKNYSPPEGGAAAITTNDYLMLGTQLGWPGLICFISYVALCFRKAGRASRLSSERDRLLQIETGGTAR